MKDLKQIASFYYFDYTKDIGGYESFRNFCLDKMVYLSMALSTSKIRVNASPVQYKISFEKSEDIRSVIEQNREQLVVIEEPKEEMKMRYFKVIYTDGLEECYQFNEKIYSIFKNINEFKIDEKYNVLLTPYLIFENQEYSSKVKKMQEMSELIKSKKINMIESFLNDNCVFEDLTNNLKFENKNLILKEYKKRVGFFNSNLSKVKLYSTLEGMIDKNGESKINIKVEVTDKNYTRTNYLLNIEFNDRNQIVYISLDFAKNIKSKTIYGEYLEKVLKAKYNDFKS